MLIRSDRPLWEVHDLAMLDLDGVVYIDGEAVPGAPDHLAAAREHDLRLAFITNNASRPPEVVAEHLTTLGVPADVEDVVTSAQAAAHVLRERLGDGAAVLAVGGAGLVAALRAEGLRPVGVEEDAVAVVTGYGPDVVWSDIMRAAVLVRDGLWWVASNTDMTIPTAYGVAPGHGVLVETLRRFTGVEPEVAGKPARPLLDETIRRVGGRAPLMVGDRLDTDIEGAGRAGIASLLVMTGVTGLPELVAAGPDLRPSYLASDLAGLGTAQPVPDLEHDAAGSPRGRLAGWSASIEGGRLSVDGDGGPSDWWRLVAVVAWAHLDHVGDPVDVADLEPPRPHPSATAAAR